MITMRTARALYRGAFLLDRPERLALMAQGKPFSFREWARRYFAANERLVPTGKLARIVAGSGGV